MNPNHSPEQVIPAAPRPPAPPVPRLLLSEVEAGKALGVSSRTVFSLRKAGKLASVSIGTRRLYSVADLEAFIARARTVAGQ
jgi:excisionase family DNA binding protein